MNEKHDQPMAREIGLKDNPSIQKVFQLWKSIPRAIDPGADDWDAFEAFFNKFAEKESVEPSMLELALSVPLSVIAKSANCELWELCARGYCEGLVTAQTAKKREAAAKQIGRLIADQLISKRYDAPRIVGEHLLNAMSNTAHEQSAREEVMMAFAKLNLLGLEHPTQSDIAKFLRLTGKTITRDRLSKTIDSLGLKSHLRDGRDSRTPKFDMKLVSSDVDTFSLALIPLNQAAVRALNASHVANLSD